MKLVDFLIAARVLRLDDGGFDESKHPRDESGRFTDGSGSPLPAGETLGVHDASGGPNDLAGEFRGPKGRVYELHLNGKTYEISDRTDRPDTYPWSSSEIPAVSRQTAEFRLEDALTQHALTRSGMVTDPEGRVADHRVIGGVKYDYDKIIKVKDPEDPKRKLLFERLYGNVDDEYVKKKIPIGWVRRAH